jgi:chromosome segregation ATPase
MSDTVTRLAEALDDLRAELAHADQLITEQQNRIQTLERRVQILRGKLYAQEGAA